jgi:hypothetical protein
MWKGHSLQVALALFVALGCDSPKPEQDAPPATSPSGPHTADSSQASEKVDLSEARRAFVEKLSRAVDLVEKAPKKPKKCPATLAGEAHAYAFAYARHIAKSAELPKAAAEMTAFRPSWHRLLEGEPSMLDADSAARLKHVFEREHVVIVTADELVLPALSDDKSFLSGEFEGWARVVDLAQGKVTCTTALKFISSEKVEWTESLSAEQAAQQFDIAKSDAAFHVRVDFFIQGQKALTSALKSVAPELKVELRGKR